MKKLKKTITAVSDVKAGFEGMNDLYQRIYRVVKQIPPGRVTSYGAIANYIGFGGSARLVGWAMNASHYSSAGIPAHRVVNRNGLLSGKHHFETWLTMQELLESEGVKIVDDEVIDFDKVFWDPARELGFKDDFLRISPPTFED
jgi:methylated-DNA-protein-cysteine methyltransferase-like protein